MPHSRIEHIFNWGPQWSTVRLACGHSRKVRKTDLAREQLFVGKTVECADCQCQVASRQQKLSLEE